MSLRRYKGVVVELEPLSWSRKKQSAEKVVASKAMEEARRRAVIAMKHGKTLCLDLGAMGAGSNFVEVHGTVIVRGPGMLTRNTLSFVLCYLFHLQPTFSGLLQGAHLTRDGVRRRRPENGAGQASAVLQEDVERGRTHAAGPRRHDCDR